jgi:hypothetical protein
VVVDSIIRRAREARVLPRLWRRLAFEVRTVLDDAPESGITPADLRSWIEAAHRPGATDLRGRRLIVFAYLPYWIDYMTAVSAALVARGADVTFAWLPYSGIDRELPQRDPELLARYGSVLGQAYPRFRGVNLLTISGPIGDAADRLDQIAYIDTQYLLRREEIDVNEDDRHILRFRSRRVRHAYGAMRRLIAEREVDAVLVPSGGVLEFAAAWEAASDAGKDNVTLESWERLGTIAVAQGRPCFHDIAREIWAADPKTVDPARRERVARTMKQREQPNWRGHVISYQTADARGAAAMRAELGLDDRRPIALVCPNVPYDAAFLGIEAAFPSMADWLRTLVRELAPRRDWQVVIRAHPGETALQSRQSAESILASAAPQLPEHFRFIPPAARVNTYALMRMADVGLVFGSTTGLEMAARGLPVVMPAATHYTRKGFTRDAFERDAYVAAVRAELDGPRRRLSEAEIDLAWCYTDVYMNQWCRPFPWCLPSFEKDIKAWPLERVVGDEGTQRFGETFTILAGGDRAQAALARPVLIEPPA